MKLLPRDVGKPSRAGHRARTREFLLIEYPYISKFNIYRERCSSIYTYIRLQYLIMHSYLQKDDSYSFSLLNEKKKIGAEIKTVEKLSLREE